MENPTFKFNRTKIIATCGPSTGSAEMIEQLIFEGVDLFRLNFSHGDHQTHGRMIDMIREVAERLNINISIFGDLCGPKLRLGKFFSEINVETDDLVSFYLKNDPGGLALPIDVPEFCSLVEPDSIFYIDDGMVSFQTVEVKSDHVLARALNRGVLKSRKGVNIPDMVRPVAGFTEKDKADLAFCLSQGINLIAVSFVQSAEDIAQVKRYCQQYFEIPLYTIAKIEKPQALINLNEILEITDAVMVARGDLGIEVAQARLPIIQKEIIQKSNDYLRPVICATQMLQSMVESPKPTRAEITDISNAVLDGSDAVMLSAETAVGAYPLESVRTMRQILTETETHLLKKIAAADFGRLPSLDKLETRISAVATAAARAAVVSHAPLVFSLTEQGRSALILSGLRLAPPIIALPRNTQIVNFLNLIWGVLVPDLVVKDSDDLEATINFLADSFPGISVNPGDNLVVVYSSADSVPDTVRVIEYRKESL